MKLSIIWNLTRRCVWDCPFCCVGAVTKDQNGSQELSFEEKIRVLDCINMDARIDFSGGELLIDKKNIDVVLYASEKFGAENIGISTSGARLNNEIISKLKNKIADVEVTLDYLPDKHYTLRPKEYHKTAAKAIKRLKKHNFEVGVQTVLTKYNMNKKDIDDLYKYIKRNRIDTWSLLRFFESGRGVFFNDITPSTMEYEIFIGYMRNKYNSGSVDLHFQYLLPNHQKYTSECRAVKKSIGILPDGTVVACFWALDENMKATDNKFILGKLPETDLNSILNNPKSQYWKTQSHKCILFKNEIELTPVPYIIEENNEFAMISK